MDIVGLDAYFQDAYLINGYDQLEVGPQNANGSFNYSLLINAIKQKYPNTITFWLEMMNGAQLQTRVLQVYITTAGHSIRVRYEMVIL